MNHDLNFFRQLHFLQISFPERYKLSGLCKIIKDPEGTYSIDLPKLSLGSSEKNDSGNANTRGRYIDMRIREFLDPVSKTENYRILYTKIADLFGKIAANFFLKEDISGAIYVHNGENVVTKPYCFAYDFNILAEKGAFFTDIGDKPAQHLDSFIQHVIEFVAVTCRETTGAVGLPALFPYMWYYWNKDCRSGYAGDTEGINNNVLRYLKQQIQMLVYKLNGSEMRTNESAFTNVSIMDESYLEHFFGDRVFPDGTTVIEHISDIVELEVFFLEVVNGILAQKVMTFPVITDCLLFDAELGEFVNAETARRFSDLNLKWSNANMYCGTDISALSSCCRVLNDTKVMATKLKGFSNFIGGSDLNIGSVGVITINLPHLTLSAPDLKSFLFELAKEIVSVCHYLEAIRGCIQDLIDEKVLKLYDLGLAKLERQFNTIGFIGLYDAAKNLQVKDVLQFEETVLKLFKSISETMSEGKPFSINIEQIPGESSAVKLAKKDQIFIRDENLPESKLSRSPVGCYTNQWLPLDEPYSIMERCDYAAVLDKLCGGGSILHLNIDEPLTSMIGWKLLNDIAARGVIYFAFNTRISVDRFEHGFHGDTCWCGEPKTGEATRPVGFITLVKNWIPSRQVEYSGRIWTNNTKSQD